VGNLARQSKGQDKMTSKANQTSASAPQTSKATGIDVAALLARIADLTAETLAHPQVINKSEAGVASRVARFLNKEAQFPCEAHRFWTGSHVLAYVAKNSK
jgi:hypothetical protein